MFDIVEALAHEGHGTERLCRILRVAPSGFFRWRAGESEFEGRRRAVARVIIVGSVVLLIGSLVMLRQDRPSSLVVAAGDPLVCDPLAADNPYCLGEPETTTTVPSVDTTVTTPPAPDAPSVPVVRLEGSDGPLRASVEIRPANAAAGEIVRFVLRSTEPEGRESSTGAIYGDGGPYAIPGESALHCFVPVPTTTAVPPDETQTSTFEHAYRVPGTYHVLLRVTSSGCGEPHRTVDLTGTVVVGPGPLLSNGPLPPIVIGARQLPGNGSSTVEMNVHVRDRDGYIRTVTVDWEDGSPKYTKSYATALCVDPESHWPGPTGEAFVVNHTYATAGTYDATVTVESVGCAGQDLQTATSTATLVAS